MSGTRGSSSAGGTDAVVFSGYLEKLGGWIKNWKRRWFVLQRSQLTYYTDEAEAAQGPAFARGSLMVCGSSLRALEPSAASGKQFAIGLTQACSTRLYVFIAPNEQARIDWLTAFVKAGGGSTRGSVSMGSPAGGLLGGAAKPLSPLPERMFAASSHEGFLQKLGGLQKTSWQSRYFVLLSDQLLYFREPNFTETSTDNDAPRGSISLRGATLLVEPRSVEVYGVPHAFSITPAEPQRSLMSALFSKETRAYVMVAKDYVDLSTWVTRLKEKMEKSTEPEENSDSEEEEQRPPATESAAAPTASASASSFVPPTGDVLSSLYKLDSSTIDGGGGLDTGGWKKRYSVLELKGKTLRLWKRKPSADEPASKPKTVDLKFASLTVNATLKCSKAKNIPVLTISFPPAKDDAAAPYSSPFLHLAPSTQSRFDSWLSFLTLACGKKRRTPSAAAAQQEADEAAANASAEQTPAPAPAAAKPSSRKASTADSESAAPASKQPPRAKRRSATDPNNESTAPAEKRSQSQLLADMSAALADDDAMASFRTGCADLARGALTSAQFFKGFWRTFGKRLGRVFWTELVSIIPHEETQNELLELYEQHRHVLEAKSAAEETEEAATEAAASSPDPSPSPVAPSMPSFHPRPANGHTVPAGANSLAEAAMPSFVPPLPHEWTPVSPVSSSSSDFSSPTNSQQPSASSPTAAQQRKGSAGPSSASAAPVSPATPPPAAAAADSSSDDPASRAHSVVSAWSLRCDHNILTLLCTLHEVLPSVVSVGQFIPFDDGYPGLKQVHSCYLKAVRVLHPDKTKHLSVSVQILGQAVFQTVQAAWEKYERIEKRKANKEAQKAAAAAAAGEQLD